MTGATDWSALQWVVGLIISTVIACVATGGVFWRYNAWIVEQFSKRDLDRAAELAKHDIALQSAVARATVAEEELRRSLEAHKLYAAEHFATNESVGKAMEGIQKSIDRLADRLDRLLPAITADAPAPRSR